MEGAERDEGGMRGDSDEGRGKGSSLCKWMCKAEEYRRMRRRETL